MALTDYKRIEHVLHKERKIQGNTLKQSVFIIVMGLLFSISIQAQAGQPSIKPARTFGMGYAQRFLWYDTDHWNALIPSGKGLPELDGPLRLHGGVFYGYLTNWLVVGLSAYGSLQEKENEQGYTNFEGSFAGFFLEARKPLLYKFYGTAGLTFSCGRFHVGSMSEAGQGLSGHSDVFFAEPSLGIGYHIVNALNIKVFWSSLFGFLVKNDWVGEDEEHKVLPEGHMISLMLTYDIPSL